MVNVVRTPQTFYRRTASKNVVQWTIWLEEDQGIYTIKTSHGQKGGKITGSVIPTVVAFKAKRMYQIGRVKWNNEERARFYYNL